MQFERAPQRAPATPREHMPSHEGHDIWGGSMERKRLNASNMRAVGYDPRNRVLEIEFSDGRINQYSGVSEEVHRRLMNSPSPGSYFHDNIEESFTAKRVR